jgi:hypothetical protein
LRKNGKIPAFGLMIFLTLAFVSSVSAQAQKRVAKDWSIADYFKNLPEKYITASGDFMPRSNETAVIDEKNGYAAYLSSPPQPESGNPPFPIFETALFKSQTKPPLLVVVNQISDSVCTEYKTFFLRRVGSDWTEVKREVLPPMNLKMFWDTPQSAPRLLKIIKESSTSYHFEPPRQGTRMKVSLEICDYLEDDTPREKVKELSKRIESAKPIYLTWDKQNSKFNFAK